MSKTDKIEIGYEIEVTLHIIGGKWKSLIIYQLISNSPLRFNQLHKLISRTSQRTLTNQLRELESDGIISRKIYAEVPPKVEYSITEKGKTLYPILESMCEWGEKNQDDRFIITNPQCK